MFDKKYYKTRFIYVLEGSEYKALVEPNFRRNEVYVYLPDEEKEGSYAMYLRKMDRKPIDKNRLILLDHFLANHGYTDSDFSNPFTRTKKIVNELDKINALNQKTLTKK